MSNFSVKLKWITPDAEKEIMYCARVSSPNQDSTNTGLLKFCVKNKHWSIFQMANMNVEVETSRAISAQILRHASIGFQEFSQRYAKVLEFQFYEARSQDTKDRQNSIDDMSEEDKDWFMKAQEYVCKVSTGYYNESLSRGIAKEQARFLLPMSAKTKMYMNGTIRSWIHYLNLRCGNGTQKEHMDIAIAIRDTIFKPAMPVIAEALEW